MSSRSVAASLVASANGDLPVRGIGGDLLEVHPAGQDGGRRLGAPSGEPREPVRTVADEGEVIGDGRGADAELCHDTGLVDQEVLAAIELDDAGARDALPEVLVGRADDHLLDAGVVPRHGRRTGQRVVRLELDHRPDHHAERGERLLERPRLGPQVGVDALAGLVPGPQLVAEGLDNVIGRDPDMGGAVAQQLQDRTEHAPDGCHLVAGRVAMRRRAEEVAEQLVGPVDEVHLHGRTECVTWRGGARHRAHRRSRRAGGR